MGLDMYLSARKYINRIDFSHKADTTTETLAFRQIIDATETREAVEPEGFLGLTVEIPVMYWRKANAIHNWFIRELADGVDDCRPLELTVERLRDLVRLCERVVDDHSKAEELLPTGSGFFFGGTGYDEYYFEGIAHTADRLRYVVAEMEAQDIDWLVYQASW